MNKVNVIVKLASTWKVVDNVTINKTGLYDYLDKLDKKYGYNMIVDMHYLKDPNKIQVMIYDDYIE